MVVQNLAPQNDLAKCYLIVININIYLFILKTLIPYIKKVIMQIGNNVQYTSSFKIN